MTHRSILLLLLALLFTATTYGQRPAGITDGYGRLEVHPPLDNDLRHVFGSQITSPPGGDLRTMAEWEEIQSLVIAWRSYPAVLKQITAHAKEECEVIIISPNVGQTTSYLQSTNNGGPAFPDLDNITIVSENVNTIWIRDYGQHTVYRDDVGDQILVDWIYNRPRPADDATPVTIAEMKGLPLYATTESPWDLMATGGNFMSDGLGTAFSSELIIDENDGGNTEDWNLPEPDHSLEGVNDILEAFMGIDRYILMETLPYDGIHHIDMHMKLLDEETLLIGEYPEGVADGPQIEANMEYVMSNYDSPFGTPYKVERIQMPPQGGYYPDTFGDYRTYTNMVFVNKKVLVPVYEAQYDVPALEILEDLLPGYEVIGINCNDIIQASGAIHCITKAVGVDDPMHIVHQPLVDTDEAWSSHTVAAMIDHRSGITSGMLTYRVNAGPWVEAEMIEVDSETRLWSADIAAQPVGSMIDYYVTGVAESGKSLSRPLTAPEGYWTFEILGEATSLEEFASARPLQEIYPNPAGAITVIPIDLPTTSEVRVGLLNMVGQQVALLHQGMLASGEHKLFIDAAEYAPGVYMVRLTAEGREWVERLVIK